MIVLEQGERKRVALATELQGRQKGNVRFVDFLRTRVSEKRLENTTSRCHVTVTGFQKKARSSRWMTKDPVVSTKNRTQHLET